MAVATVALEDLSGATLRVTLLDPQQLGVHPASVQPLERRIDDSTLLLLGLLDGALAAALIGLLLLVYSFVIERTWL